MKNSTIGSLKMALAISAAFLAVGTITPSFHFVSSARAAAGADEDKTDIEKAHEAMEEIVRSNEEVAGRARAFEIATRLKMNPDELVDFFKSEEAAGKRTNASDYTWAQLLKGTHVKMSGNVSGADYKTAETNAEMVSAFIQAKRTKAADNLRLTANDILKVQTSKEWTPEERANYASVLRLTADKAIKGETVTLEDAYQKALSELGFEKANKACKN